MTTKPLLLALLTAVTLGASAHAQVPQSPGSSQSRPSAPVMAPLVPAPPARPAEIAIPSTPAPEATARPSAIEIPSGSSAASGGASAPQGMAALLDGMAMPGIIVPLLQGKENDLPDDRSVRTYIFTVLSTMSRYCGDRSPEVALAGTGYIAPDFAPGRDMAEAGGKALLGMLGAIAQAHRTGDIRDLAAIGGAGSPPFSKTAGEDTALLISRLSCQSDPYRDFEAAVERLVQTRSGSEIGDEDSLRFTALMSPDYRRRNGIPDPAVAMRERRLQTFQRDALASCQNRFAKPEFCGCAVNGLKSVELDDAAWVGIGKDFGDIVAAAKQRPVVARAVRSCIYAER